VICLLNLLILGTMKAVLARDGQEQNWNNMLSSLVSTCGGYNRILSVENSKDVSMDCLVRNKSAPGQEDTFPVNKFIDNLIQASLNCGVVFQKELASAIKVSLKTFDIEGLWKKSKDLGDMTIEEAAQYLFHVPNPSPMEVYTAHWILHISSPFFVLESGKFESRPCLMESAPDVAASTPIPDNVELATPEQDSKTEQSESSESSAESTPKLSIDLNVVALPSTPLPVVAPQPQSPTESKVQECKYSLLKRIGEGVFGEVYLSKFKDSTDARLFALKKLSKNHPKFRRTAVFREVNAGKLLEHEGVIRFEETFETASSVYLVMEYFGGHDLYTTLEDRNYQPYSEHAAKEIFKQLVHAVTHCHQRGIAHRDIKLENILMDKYGKTKLIDFGLCDYVMDVGNTTRLCIDSVGSPAYISPEILAGKP